ncbi:2-isopropylmalate synthase [Candidatus Annandia adelgestsuga]|uniref:2-isopropylmalate synthase n=1 Tax=Candidatus Annandia adelgestsuga TaxID=1302411 RepID=A0A3Q9CLB9_9ENTR|nr:2-isopropylmalate synthase [Candidatus Annandia adelgestsuga]AZP36242.1 2-isopropylmalate synthase [Candidatus Annandia adelgestsuga]
MNNKIIILDTTLRDGEQSLKSSLNVQNKLEIAFSLERMGIDIIEAGFPISSPGEFESVKNISKNIKNSKVCALARCLEKDIDAAYESLKFSNYYRIHIFIATSPIHIKTKLKSKLSDIISLSVKMVKYAKKYTDDIEFSCEDGGRTPINDLCYIVESVIKAGANTINIPDTVGYTLPNEYSNIINKLLNNVINIDKAIISVHTHNDLGMATGNAISAIQAGARQIEGTINGLGERAGNCALEEIIMAIHTRKKILNLSTNINHNEIYYTSKIISKICNINIPINKPIVGSNVFSHSSGIHQDGVLKNKKNYEIMTPKFIGLNKSKLNLTSRSGRAAVNYRMKKMGYNKNDYNINKLYCLFLKFADKKGQVFDYDLEHLAFLNKNKMSNYFILKYFNVISISKIKSTAFIKILCGNKLKSDISIGYGPIDALYKTIKKITLLNIKIIKYKIKNQIINKKNLKKVNIVINYNNKKFYGMGLNNNILKSSIKAIINIINSIWLSKKVKKLKFK